MDINSSKQFTSLPNHNILKFNSTTNELQLREAIILVGRILYQSGLMVSNDGNISVKMSDGNILITPAGVCKGRISPDDLIVVDPQGKLLQSAIDPLIQPTSELPMHLEVYLQRPDVRAVIHTHLVYANALAISKGEIRMDVIPEALVAFGEVPITDFAIPSSSQNAKVIRELIKEHDVLVLRNHGSLAVGRDLDQALIHTERLEHVCKTLVYAEVLGDIHQLPTEMIEELREVKDKGRRNAKI
ncbi:MAG TPA: class II aldolase/adducin family protein [Anaerolineaceae bacterium]|nr:class II aldolase/adducin family protein [Anaerolineaceae bacterium]